MTSPMRRLAYAFDRGVIAPWRWVRLRRELDAMGAGPVAVRRAVQQELRRQIVCYGPALDLPFWVRELLGPERPARETPTPANRDAAALRGLVHYLNARDGAPLSLAARDYAANREGLGERWADAAVKRLAAAGILRKERGSDGRLPSWRMVPLDDALTWTRKGRAALTAAQSARYRLRPPEAAESSSGPVCGPLMGRAGQTASYGPRVLGGVSPQSGAVHITRSSLARPATRSVKPRRQRSQGGGGQHDPRRRARAS